MIFGIIKAYNLKIIPYNINEFFINFRLLEYSEQSEWTDNHNFFLRYASLCKYEDGYTFTML